MNDKPIWLDKQFVLWLHERTVERIEGSQGVRDEALLESALSRPQNLYHYEEADIFDLAAAYAEGISSNHPFVDSSESSGSSNVAVNPAGTRVYVTESFNVYGQT